MNAVRHPFEDVDVRIVVVPAVLMISTHCRILTHNPRHRREALPNRGGFTSAARRQRGQLRLFGYAPHRRRIQSTKRSSNRSKAPDIHPITIDVTITTTVVARNSLGDGHVTRFSSLRTSLTRRGTVGTRHARRRSTRGHWSAATTRQGPFAGTIARIQSRVPTNDRRKSLIR